MTLAISMLNNVFPLGKHGQVHNSIALDMFDSKLYTNFKFCRGKNHKHLYNTLIYKAKQFMLKNLS